MEGIHSSGGSSLAEDWSGAPTSSDHPHDSPQIDSSQPKAHNPEVVIEETMCRRSTFYVNVDWRMGATLATVTNIVGQMYVECLEPARRLYPYPIILIHGDFHTGQTTKPDGRPGWASFFLNKGFQVYIVDLPPSGRSNFLTPSHYLHRDVGTASSLISARAIETSLTAPGIPRERNIPLQYEKAALHDKWPGSGQRGDPIFAKYCASLATLHLNKVERQSLAQNALQALLGHVGKSVLVGEGSGGNMTWLATDVEPDLVAGTIALEPAGPPFGTACPKEGNPYREYSPYIRREEGVRIYGLTDIPLTYDPPCHPHEGFDRPAQDPLDVARVLAPDRKSECFVQRGKLIRKLINLAKIPTTIVTAHASSHGMYDWATVYFLNQAGVKCGLIRLEERNILGNGHLMFLEKNSDEVAQVVLDWILENTIPKSYLNILSLPSTPPGSNEVAELIAQARPRKRYSIDSNSSRLSGQETHYLSSQSTDEEVSQALSLRTPPVPSSQASSSRENGTDESSGRRSIDISSKRVAPSSGQSTVSMSGQPQSPYPRSSSAQNHKRPRLGYSTAMSTSSASSPSLPTSNQTAATWNVTQQQYQPTQQQQPAQQQPAQQNYTQQSQVSNEEYPTAPDISTLRPTHPGGGPPQLRQQGSTDGRSPITSPALSHTSQIQAPRPFRPRQSSLYEHLPLGQQIGPAQRDNQRNFNYNNSHTTARFERQAGTAEESIAAMAMYNQGRPGSGLAHPAIIPGQQRRSPMVQPQQHSPGPRQMGQSPALSNKGGHQQTSAPTSSVESTSMAGIWPPFTPVPPFVGGRVQAPFNGFAQSTPPSPSPAPRQSLNPDSYDRGKGSPVPSGSQQTPTPK
ncbi:hypothetical protein ACHAPA_002435 [Fusarium lateritium]